MFIKNIDSEIHNIFVFFSIDNQMTCKGFKNQLDAEKFMNNNQNEYFVIKGQALDVYSTTVFDSIFYKIKA